jgi:UDP-glucose 4-epimerase
MKTVAITGAGGFIGRRIAQAALDAGWRVRAFTRAPEKLSANLAPLSWDLTESIPPDLLEGVDVVCHGAAYRPGDLNDDAQAERCMQLNAEGTLKLLRAAHAAHLPRFVYLSAGNAYQHSNAPIKESAQLFPVKRAAYYLASKLAGEIYVEHWDQLGKISGCILRISSVYGPGMDERGLIAVISRRLKAGQKVTLQNAGSFAADMVYVDDVARAAVAALDAPVHGPVNVGSGALSTSRDIATALAAILRAPEALIEPEPAKPEPDVGFGALDVTRARHELGFRPTTLYDGLTLYAASLEGFSS